LYATCQKLEGYIVENVTIHLWQESQRTDAKKLALTTTCSELSTTLHSLQLPIVTAPNEQKKASRNLTDSTH
jgi:hypothetical protein